MLQHAGAEKIWFLEGEIGAGKTTLIKALCAQLGVQELVNSPTFSLIHEYATAAGEVIYHFDFYRIGCEEEIVDLDCAALMDSGSYCFVEWPSKIKTASLASSTYCSINIAAQSTYQRLIFMQLHGFKGPFAA